MGNEIQSIAEIVRVHGVDRAEQVALVQDDRSLTWGELYARAQQMAGFLASVGVGPEDRVAMLEKNGIEHFEVFYGAALLNAVCVDVNWRLAPPEVEYIVNDSAAKVFVVGADFVPVLDAIEPNLATVQRTLVIGRDYEGAVDAAPTGDPGERSAIDDVAFQLYSSGTTGRPKGVLLSNANVVALVPQTVDT